MRHSLNKAFDIHHFGKNTNLLKGRIKNHQQQELRQSFSINTLSSISRLWTQRKEAQCFWLKGCCWCENWGPSASQWHGSGHSHWLNLAPKNMTKSTRLWTHSSQHWQKKRLPELVPQNCGPVIPGSPGGRYQTWSAKPFSATSISLQKCPWKANLYRLMK